MPLEQPGDRAAITAVIRHPALGAVIRVAFDALWERGRPLGGDALDGAASTRHARSRARGTS
jgi:hypothetical protein